MDVSDLITDINVNANININFDIMESASMSFSKINIYNPNIDIPLQKFWFYIENIRIAEVSNSNTYIKFALSENCNKKLIHYIDKLDNHIDEYIKQNIDNNYKFTPSIKKSKNFFPILKAKLSTSSIIYDTDDTIIKTIKKNDIVNMYLEISNIWLNNDENTVWICYQILQIKKNNIYDAKKSLFTKNMFKKDIQQPLINNNIDDIKPINTLTTYPRPLLPPVPTNNKVIKPVSQIQRVCRPSIGEILNQLSNLKKIPLKTDTDADDVNDENKINVNSMINHKIISSDFDNNSIDGQANESINEPANEPANESINEPANEPANESINESINEPANESINESINEPVNEPINEPANELVNEPANELVNEPANKHNDDELYEKDPVDVKKYDSVINEMIRKIQKINKRTDKALELVDEKIRLKLSN